MSAYVANARERVQEIQNLIIAGQGQEATARMRQELSRLAVDAPTPEDVELVNQLIADMAIKLATQAAEQSMVD